MHEVLVDASRPGGPSARSRELARGSLSSDLVVLVLRAANDWRPRSDTEKLCLMESHRVSEGSSARPERRLVETER